MSHPKKRTTPLTREELFGAALSIADADGLDALTMRRLGEAVGVEAASLYHHVPNKDALLDGVISRARSEMRLPDPMPTGWMEIMEAIFGEYRRVLAAHPNLLPLAGRRVEGESNDGLLFLVQQGFSYDDAVELFQSLIAFTVGFSVFSSPLADADTTGLPAELGKRMAEWHDETCFRTLRVILEGYDAARMAAAGDPLPR